MRTLSFDLTKTSMSEARYKVTGRANDGELTQIRVVLKNNDEPIDLTDYTILFEGIKPNGTKYIDSEHVMVENAAEGIFVYTFSKNAFSRKGNFEQAYFVIEKDGKRDSTNSFLISVLESADGDFEADTNYNSKYETVLEDLKSQMLTIAGYDEKIGNIESKIGSLKEEISSTLGNKVSTIALNSGADIENVITATKDTIGYFDKEISYSINSYGSDIPISISGNSGIVNVGRGKYREIYLVTDGFYYINDQIIGTGKFPYSSMYQFFLPVAISQSVSIEELVKPLLEALEERIKLLEEKL